MDYEFFRNITGQVRAKFSMGHEAIGYWLNEEVNGDLTLISQITDAAQQLQQTGKEWKLAGHEYSVFIAEQEVMVRANQLDFSHDEMVEDFQYYDAESIAVCGLTDFLLMLAQYQRFITEPKNHFQ